MYSVYAHIQSRAVNHTCTSYTNDDNRNAHKLPYRGLLLFHFQFQVNEHSCSQGGEHECIKEISHKVYITDFHRFSHVPLLLHEMKLNNHISPNRCSSRVVLTVYIPHCCHLFCNCLSQLQVKLPQNLCLHFQLTKVLVKCAW